MMIREIKPLMLHIWPVALFDFSIGKGCSEFISFLIFITSSFLSFRL